MIDVPKDRGEIENDEWQLAPLATTFISFNRFSVHIYKLSNTSGVSLSGLCKLSPTRAVITAAIFVAFFHNTQTRSQHRAFTHRYFIIISVPRDVSLQQVGVEILFSGSIFHMGTASSRLVVQATRAMINMCPALFGGLIRLTISVATCLKGVSITGTFSRGLLARYLSSPFADTHRRTGSILSHHHPNLVSRSYSGPCPLFS
ncbi:hypothetical protein PoB_003341100 [Plakobranchus ocellatus]|uniref:Uncharacterized protein n=1 Tax=Plakobranchus ocellatus TaxID=259542 RepID=A0AAV4AF18_9GAST|nr:hypothetical protein PoB_003341100 [Plakobranchus ocellatus]